MATPSPIARLTDIIEAIELIRSEMAGVKLQVLESDKRMRWLVERGEAAPPGGGAALQRVSRRRRGSGFPPRREWRRLLWRRGCLRRSAGSACPTGATRW